MKKILFLSVAVCVAAVLATSSVFAKNNNKGNSLSNSKSEKVKELKNFEKPNNSNSNSKLYRENVENVSNGLKAIASEKKNEEKNQNKGNSILNREQEANGMEEGDIDVNTANEDAGIANEVEEVASEVEENKDEVADAIDEVESKNKFKKFLVGTDYKNLGQLRSNLVHNENQIRRLTKLTKGTVNEEDQVALQEQLTVLMQERERIKTVITDNEGGFSLLGWVFKFMNAYPTNVINEQNEVALAEEVAQATDSTNLEATETPAVEDGTQQDDITQTGEVQDVQQ